MSPPQASAGKRNVKPAILQMFGVTQSAGSAAEEDRFLCRDNAG
jgi:hypothetical protein